MRKTFFLLFMAVILLSCSDKSTTQEFQIFGAEDEIPLFYFSGDNITGNVKGTLYAEIKADENTEAQISCTFHLAHEVAGKYWEKDIITETFTLKKGETFKLNRGFSFYGKIYDKAAIVLDIKTTATFHLDTSPVRIVNSKVEIIK